MLHFSHIVRVLIICASLFQIQCTSSDDDNNNDALDAFLGKYTGSSSNVAEGEISERDLSVTINSKKDGEFTVGWTVTMHLEDGSQKRTETSIDFQRSPRPGIFTSAMRKDVFDNMVSDDPTSAVAAPFVWASLHDDTLIVRALYILETGEYEMHTYNRSLVPEGLSLEFERTRNTDLVTKVSALLKRVE